MLTQHRRVQIKRLRKVREPERKPGHIEIAEDAIVHGPNRSALAQMRSDWARSDRGKSKKIAKQKGPK